MVQGLGHPYLYFSASQIHTGLQTLLGCGGEVLVVLASLDHIFIEPWAQLAKNC